MKHEVTEERIVRVYVNPAMLRKWANDMEEHMATCRAGQFVWTYPLWNKDMDLKVEMIADQEYPFIKR